MASPATMPHPESADEFRLPSTFPRCHTKGCHEAPVADARRTDRAGRSRWRSRCAWHLSGTGYEVRDGQVWSIRNPEAAPEQAATVIGTVRHLTVLAGKGGTVYLSFHHQQTGIDVETPLGAEQAVEVAALLERAAVHGEPATPRGAA